MQYKTIALELLQQLPPNPSSSDSLHSQMESLAIRLRNLHLEIVEELQRNRPNDSPMQRKSEAMEIALEQIREELNSKNVT